MTKTTPRIFISLLLMLLCIGILPVSAFASSGDYPDDTLPAVESSAADTQEPKQIGTVTTNGGNLNVRTGAGLDNTAFTQLPNGTVVDVIGRDGDWVKILLPARVGYVYGGYLTVTDAADSTVSIGGITLPLDEKELTDLWQLLVGSMTGGSDALTPDGNLTLIDDIGSSTKAGKQFITLESKNGNTFYLIIDRDDEGEETVHFLNQVDEADLMALTGEEETPAVCSCTTKCVAGAVNTSCPVCAVNMTECVGKEAKPEVPAEPTEPAAEEPEKKSGVGGILVVLLIVALGGGAAFYIASAPFIAFRNRNRQPVFILQRKQQLAQRLTALDTGNVQRRGRNAQRLRQRTEQSVFRCSCTRFILCDADVSSFGRKACCDAQRLLRHAPQHTKVPDAPSRTHIVAHRSLLLSPRLVMGKPSRIQRQSL